VYNSLENQRAKERANQALHDSIVRVPGGSRFMRDGESIKPMGPKLAAEVIHRSHDEIRNMADPNKHDHRFYADEVQEMLLEGMDPAWFEECLRDVDIICIKTKKPAAGVDLTEALLACGQKMGVVCESIAYAIDPESRGGKRITSREFDAIARAVSEEFEELSGLLDAAKRRG